MNEPNQISDFSPTSLSHLVGQRKVIEQVEVALDAAQQDGKKLDHSLMVGPPGLGKSALAQVIAQEMATGFHEVLGQSLNSAAELNALLLGAKKRDIVFIDECHEMRKEFQTALYLALDKQKIFVKTGTGTPMGLYGQRAASSKSSEHTNYFEILKNGEPGTAVSNLLLTTTRLKSVRSVMARSSSLPKLGNTYSTVLIATHNWQCLGRRTLNHQLRLLRHHLLLQKRHKLRFRFRGLPIFDWTSPNRRGECRCGHFGHS